MPEAALANQSDDEKSMLDAQLIDRTLDFVRALATDRDRQLTVLTIALAIACYEWQVDGQSAVENFVKALDDVDAEVFTTNSLH